MRNSGVFVRIRTILLLFVIILAFLPFEAVSAAATAKQTNGSFIVEVWDSGTYRRVASFSTDEFQKEFVADIGNMTNPVIRIRKSADGLAFLDCALLDGRADLDNAKLKKTDFDVQEITEEGIVLHFKGSFDGNLSLCGRIEPKVIIGEPIMFPFGNTYINDPQKLVDFLPYHLDSNLRTVNTDGVFENMGEAFESRYLVSSTGHPSGYAYIYISNDDQYLYAVADFTCDNTYDYGNDFFKVFADVDGTVKEFKQTSDGNEFGSAAMQYTDKVTYEHMYYEVKIPLDQLGNSDELNLAFSLYGTFAIASMTSDPASLSFTAGLTANAVLRIGFFSNPTDSPISVEFVDLPELTVQFQTSPLPVVQDGDYIDIPYTVSSSTPGDYALLITSYHVGEDQYYAELHIPIEVVAPTAVSFTAHPANLTITQGQGATFTVTAAGSPPYSYQWEKSSNSGTTWADIVDAKTDTLTLSAVAFSENGTQYRCIVDNVVNEPATSNASTLTVNPTPISGLPDTYSMQVGDKVTWDPMPSDGTWDWSHSFFSATFNSPATFTALTEGSSTITYRLNGASKSVIVTIVAADIVKTGESSTEIWIPVGIAFVCSGAALLLIKRRKSFPQKS